MHRKNRVSKLGWNEYIREFPLKKLKFNFEKFFKEKNDGGNNKNEEKERRLKKTKQNVTFRKN